MIADAHLDLLLELAHRELRFGETGTFARTWLPLLEAGGVGLQVCPVFVELERQPEGALREALGQATLLVRAARECPDRVTLVRSLDDLEAVEGGERIGLMLAVEGVEQILSTTSSTRSRCAAPTASASAATSRPGSPRCCRPCPSRRTG